MRKFWIKEIASSMKVMVLNQVNLVASSSPAYLKKSSASEILEERRLISMNYYSFFYIIGNGNGRRTSILHL